MWLQSPNAFNDWRRKNDLPQLIAFFKEALPHFEEWQKTFSVSDELILKSNQTSEFFIDEGLRAYFRYYNPWHWDKTHEIRSASAESFIKTKQWADQNNKQIKGSNKFEYELYTEFVPYFDWIRTSKKIVQFEVQSKYKTSAHVKDFYYNHWSGPARLSISAEIFGRYATLNLGQVRISGNLIRGKNLDFTNLDGLQITGRDISSVTFSRIRYASCRELAFVNLDMAFLELQRCHLSDINVIKSDIQDLHFIKTDGQGIQRILDSRLTKLKFDDCCPIRRNTDINRADMPDFEFVNHGGINKEDKFHFYSKMRKASQDFGYSHQAQENFYLERKYKMLYESDPTTLHEYRIADHPRLPDLFRRIKRNGLRIDKTIRSFVRAAVQQARAFSNKKLLFPYLVLRFRSLISFFNFSLWGFGERPWRVVMWMLGDIFIFALLYNHFYFHDFSPALLHSMYVFTTVGYNSQINAGLQHAVAIQALSGVFLSGLFLSALVNKVRY